MSDLDFEVLGAEPDRYAADPVLVFKLRVKENEGEVIQSVSLRCQIMIEPQRRRYTRDEEYRLLAMFGETPRWGSTVKPFLWTHATTILPGFTGTIDVNLPVSAPTTSRSPRPSTCTRWRAATCRSTCCSPAWCSPRPRTASRPSPSPGTRRPASRFPGSTWRTMMDVFFPGTGWLRIPRSTLDRLERFKTVRGLHSWDHILETLLTGGGGHRRGAEGGGRPEGGREPTVATVPGKERLVR